MPWSNAVTLAAAASLLFFGARLAYCSWRKQAGRLYPPGPRPSFLLGNAADVPLPGREAETYAAWRETYGARSLLSSVFGTLMLKRFLQVLWCIFR